MKNRAKCKLCKSIIESFHDTDYVECKCGEISVYGGPKLQCGAKDWSNFARVDDLGNEIDVKVKEDVKPLDIPAHKPSKAELLDLLDNMIERIEELPANAMSMPITHYDFCSSLILLASILRAERT